MYACILIRAMPRKVVKALEGVKGVVKTFPVYGRYDIVTFVEAPDFNPPANLKQWRSSM